MGIVYVLTNEAMPGTVKIGITEGTLEQRIKQLDNTSVALPFECYYAVEVPDAAAIEKKAHLGLDDCRVRQNREFFNTTPEQAKSILEIAEIMGGTDVTPTGDIVETPQDQQALDNARKIRRQTNFRAVGIEPGTELQFKKDATVTCEVLDDKQVSFRGEVVSLAKASNMALEELGYDLSWRAGGPNWWILDGVTIEELRREIEREFGSPASHVGRDWSDLHAILAALLPGRWTTYSDLAEVIGSHARPIGQHIANASDNEVPNGWRVLNAAGRAASGFRWYDPTETRSCEEVLQSEGVRFENGQADPTQRLRPDDLRKLIGEPVR